MVIDIEAVRADTPGCANAVHLNNAGSSLPPTPVIDAVVDYLRQEALVGGYELADDLADDLAGVYQAAADLFGGAPDQWAFVESATRAWNAAFSALRFAPGDRLLTTTAEYPSNMAGLLRAAEMQGATVEVVPDDEHGQLDLSRLEAMLDERVRLVSVTHVPTQGGLVNPAVEVGRLLADTPVLYQLDACQSVGQIPVDINEIQCDILSFTGRKFLRGPRGTGMVWAGERALAQMGNPAGVDMAGATWSASHTITPHPSARRFEPYEVFYAGKVGLAEALRYAKRVGVDRIAKHNAALASDLRAKLTELPDTTVHDKGLVRCAIVTFAVDRRSAGEVRDELRRRSINVSVSSIGSARLDFPERQLTELVRASVHYFNSDHDVDRLVDAVAELTTP